MCSGVRVVVRGICSWVRALSSSEDLAAPHQPGGVSGGLCPLRTDGLTELLPVGRPGGAELPRSRLSSSYTFLALKHCRCFGNTSPFLITSLSA